MKKILSLFLVALSALGLTATATNQVYAAPLNQPDIFIKYLDSPYEDRQLTEASGWVRADWDGDYIGFEGHGDTYFYDDEHHEIIFPDNYLLEITMTGWLVEGDTAPSSITGDNLISNGFKFKHVPNPGGDEQIFVWIGTDGNTYTFSIGAIYEFRLINQDLRPAISGQETFATKVDEARPVEYFIGFLKAIDDIDGDISDDIYIVTDNYTPNKSVLGTHEVTVGVEDSAGNVSEFTFKVSVVDITAPIINGNPAVVSIGYKETYNIANFKSTLTVTDNYDSLTASDIEIQSDGYTTNKTKLGTWNVVFEVADSSGNTSTFTKPIKVIDNVAPVFSGIETLTKSYTEVMTLSDIISQATANDEIDGNLTNKITVVNDGFTGKSNKVGTHYIELSVTDNAGNTTTRTITVKVIDDQAAGWYITNGVSINLTPGTELTRTQIVELLNKSGQVLAPANARITYLSDTYSENIGTPGTYTLAFRTVLTNGQENNYTYAVNILDDQTDEDTEVLPDLPFYEKNKILIWAIGGAALLGAAYYIFKPKKKKR